MKRTKFIESMRSSLYGDPTKVTRKADIQYEALEDDGLEDNPAINPLMGMSQDEVDRFALSCCNILREPAFLGMLKFYANFLANRAIKYANPDSLDRIQGMQCLIEMLKDDFKFHANIHTSKVVSREDEEFAPSDETI